MCEYWNTSSDLYGDRIRRGWSVEDALTKNCIKGKPVTDHKGNTFDTEKEMCSYWGITTNAYRRRRFKNNWSMEQALTTPLRTICKDHLGNTYPSQKDMCEAYGIVYSMFLNRLQKGWSLEKALMTKHRSYRTDHIGNEFKTLKALCAYWGIKPRAYTGRNELGYSEKECICPWIKDNYNRITNFKNILLIKRKLSNNMYLCEQNNHTIIMTENMIYDIIKMYNEKIST